MICLIVYVLTLQPGVTFMDSGELSGALFTFGIPHPTGYPLYLIVGYMVSNLPFGGSPVYKLNLLSAIFSSAAVFVLYFVVYNLVTILNSYKEAKKSKDAKSKQSIILDDISISLLAFFVSIVIGFSRTFWNNATFNEVYPLHSFLISLILLLCFRIFANMAKPVKKDFIFLFVVLGLSFANHMMTVLLIPGILYLFYLQKERSPFTGKLLSSTFFYIVPGLFLYLVLVSRAASQPFFNWSDPENFANLWHHVTGGDYSQIMFGGGSAFSNNIKIFGTSFISEYAIFGSVAGLLGLAIVYKKQKQIFYFLMILIVCSLIYALSYSIRDIEVYFTQVFIIFGLFVAVGIFMLLNFLGGAKPQMKIIAIGSILVVFGIYYSYSYNNNSANYVIEDLTINTLNSIEPNAVYLTYDWGYTYPAALYYQQGEHKRQDVKIFNVKFLSVPWYLENIRKYYPDVYSACSSEIEDYLKVYSAGDAKSKAMALSNLVKAFLLKCSQKFPFYVSIDFLINKEIKPMLGGMEFIPWGLVYKNVRSAEYNSNAGTESLNFTFRPFTADTPDKQKVYSTLAGMYFETGFYHYKNKNNALALKFAEKSLSINNNFADALNLKNKILSEPK